MRRWQSGARPAWLRTSEGETLRVLFRGVRNGGAGPDFRGALFLGANGRPLRGDVEVHRRVGDWWRHGHHTDGAYREVVLHVVGAIESRPGGGGPPRTLLLPPAAAGAGESHVFEPPCHGLVQRAGAQAVGGVLARLGRDRLQRKALRLRRALADGGDPDQLAYRLLLEALGQGGDPEVMRRDRGRVAPGRPPGGGAGGVQGAARGSRGPRGGGGWRGAGARSTAGEPSRAAACGGGGADPPLPQRGRGAGCRARRPGDDPRGGGPGGAAPAAPPGRGAGAATAGGRGLSLGLGAVRSAGAAAVGTVAGFARRAVRAHAAAAPSVGARRAGPVAERRHAGVAPLGAQLLPHGACAVCPLAALGRSGPAAAARCRAGDQARRSAPAENGSAPEVENTSKASAASAAARSPS